MGDDDRLHQATGVFTRTLWSQDRIAYEMARTLSSFPKFKAAMLAAIKEWTKLGEEEGEVCNREGCDGVMETRIHSSHEGGGCSCFRFAPCGYCMSQVPVCPVCDHECDPPD